MKKLAIILACMSMSTSALMIRWAEAPSAVLAFYRMLFSALMLLPPLLINHRAEIAAAPKKDLFKCLGCGAVLGLHFVLYFSSVRDTSIASALVLVDTEFLFVALAMTLIFRERIPALGWVGMGVAFVGAVIIASSDSGGQTALKGDIEALMGGVAIACYSMLGRSCRKKGMSTTLYTCLAYFGAALTMLFAVLFSGETPAATGRDLLCALGMAVFSTLLAHSVFIWGLKYVSPTFITTAKLIEPLFSTVWGALFLSEIPKLAVVIGGVITLGGVIICALFGDPEQKPVQAK